MIVLYAASLSWVAGCGSLGGDVAEPVATPVVIPGSTVTIPTSQTAAPATPVPVEQSGEPATRSPSERAAGRAARRAAESTPEATTPPTIPQVSAADLVSEVGAAMGGYGTVHVSVGADGPAVVESDHRYLGGGDYTATFRAIADRPWTAIRVDGTLYVQESTDGPFAEVDPAEAGGSILAALPFWDVPRDLFAVLDNAEDITQVADTPDIGGTPVRTYELTVDAADVVGGAQVPDDLTGAVAVTLSIDRTGLPVRVDQQFADGGPLVRTTYSAWGERVEVAVPDLG